MPLTGLAESRSLQNLRLGLFGASAGAAAALVARRGSVIKSGPLSLVADVLTLPAISSTKFAHRHF